MERRKGSAGLSDDCGKHDPEEPEVHEETETASSEAHCPDPPEFQLQEVLKRGRGYRGNQEEAVKKKRDRERRAEQLYPRERDRMVGGPLYCGRKLPLRVSASFIRAQVRRYWRSVLSPVS